MHALQPTIRYTWIPTLESGYWYRMTGQPVLNAACLISRIPLLGKDASRRGISPSTISTLIMRLSIKLMECVSPVSRKYNDSHVNSTLWRQQDLTVCDFSSDGFEPILASWRVSSPCMMADKNAHTEIEPSPSTQDILLWRSLDRCNFQAMMACLWVGLPCWYRLDSERDR